MERIQKKGEHERYYCLDDLRDILVKELTEAEYQQVEAILTTINGRDQLKDVTLHESLRPLEDWEANRRCMRSIYNIGSNGRIMTKKRRAPSQDLAFGMAIKERPLMGTANQNAAPSFTERPEVHVSTEPHKRALSQKGD